MDRLTVSGPGFGSADTRDELQQRYKEARREADRLRAELNDARVGHSSFENLFRISPFPLMEQDYTQVEQWMDELRAEGVTDLRERLPDVEAIKDIVPLIWISAANPAAARATGLSIEDLIGPVDPRIVNDEAYPSWISQLEAVWSGVPESHTAFTAGLPNGETYDAKATLAAPVVDGEPDFSRAMFTVVDVSEHRREERRMEDLIEAKNSFLASISHEIRTPLTAIVGFSQVLEDGEEMTYEDRDLMVASIVQQAREMSDLVEDLLVAARAESGQINVDLSRIDAIEQICLTLEAGGSFTDNVEFDAGSERIEATGDAARVRQILRNLLTNAERYGGPNVQVTVSRDARGVEIAVLDDGEGLPREEWEAIFQLYHRAHDGGQHTSLGIGLAVSRQLAELMGGTLEYARDDGLSVFRLKLPAAV